MLTFFEVYVPPPEPVDTTNPSATLCAQLDDMVHRHSTRIAFALASPEHRRQTARGYDSFMFDKMVRTPSYGALLNEDGDSQYRVLSEHQHENKYTAVVCVSTSRGSSHSYEFNLSLQPPSVIDDHPCLAPYQLLGGHPPQWRTDSVRALS